MGLVGADEAGKGPVLGSMFAAAIRVPDEAALPDGIRDSKTVPSEEREDLASTLQADDRVGIGLAEIPVERIDDPTTDMNTLTVAAQAEAMTGVIQPDDRIVVDASDVRPGRFAARLTDRLDQAPEVEAYHRADEDYSVVGAASVIAKVHRDAHVAALAEEYGPLGSGYPSDPETRAFLEAYVEEEGCLPDCVRTSWQTAADVLANAEQAGLADF